MNKLALGAAFAAALTATGYAQLAVKRAADPAPIQHPLAEADDVIAFWQEAGPAMWFAKDADFDRRFRERFLATTKRPRAANLRTGCSNANGTLALVILLDQFPRNSFRGTPRMYATDARRARSRTRRSRPATTARFLPSCACSSLCRSATRRTSRIRTAPWSFRGSIGPADLAHAEHHRDIVRRFGRFPHRNPILGRR